MSAGGALAKLMDSPEIRKFLAEGVQVLRRPVTPGDVSRTVTYRFPVRINNHMRGENPGLDLMRVHIHDGIDDLKTIDPRDPYVMDSDVDFMSARADARAKLGRGGSPFDEIDTSPQEKMRILRRIPAIVMSHAKLYRPDEIHWSGTSDSRDKLYAAMAERLGGADYAKPPGWIAGMQRVTPRGAPGPDFGKKIPPKDAWKLPILSALLSGGGAGALGALQREPEMA